VELKDSIKLKIQKINEWRNKWEFTLLLESN
jgi:hypothetical protein